MCPNEGVTKVRQFDREPCGNKTLKDCMIVV